MEILKLSLKKRIIFESRNRLISKLNNPHYSDSHLSEIQYGRMEKVILKLEEKEVTTAHSVLNFTPIMIFHFSLHS